MNPTSIECQICLLKTTTLKGLARHLYCQHPTQTKETYYRTYLSKDTDGICDHCGNPTAYINLSKGFHRFCNVKCARNAPEVVTQIENTNLHKHGVAYYTQADSFQERSKATKQMRYGDAYFSNSAKRQKTMLSRYGKKHNWNGPSGTRSCDLTRLSRYGSTTYANHEKGRATRLRLYGDAHFNRVACRATNLKRYGVEWPLQNADILRKSHRFRFHNYTTPSGKVLRVQGYEGYALDWLLQQYEETDILVSRGQVPTFWYTYNNKKHRYFPDAYITSVKTIVEVKSEYTLRLQPAVLQAKLEAAVRENYKVLLVVVTLSKATPTYRVVNLCAPDEMHNIRLGAPYQVTTLTQD